MDKTELYNNAIKAVADNLQIRFPGLPSKDTIRIATAVVAIVRLEVERGS